jgi:hypothetical protein
MSNPIEKDALSRLDDDGYAEAFIARAYHQNMELGNQIPAVSALYSARKTRDAAQTLFTAVGGLSEQMQRAFKAHAAALTKAAEASERHAQSLTRATWALFATTAVLAIATIALVIVEALH